MKEFLERIDAIESVFQATDEDLRRELKATQEALATAQDRVKTLGTRYKVELARGSQDAVKYKVELEVAKDSSALVEEMVRQLEADLESGELQDAMIRKHGAVCVAVRDEGNSAITAAIQTAEQARGAYKAALENLVATQHRVAQVGRQSYVRTAKLGRPVDAVQVVRYTADDFEIPAPAESASATPLL